LLVPVLQSERVSPGLVTGTVFGQEPGRSVGVWSAVGSSKHLGWSQAPDLLRAGRTSPRSSHVV